MYIPSTIRPQSDYAARSARSDGGGGAAGALAATAISVIRRLAVSALTAATPELAGWSQDLDEYHRLDARDALMLSRADGPPTSMPDRLLVRREMSENKLHIIVSVTVAIVLTAFVIASCAFMYFFRPTIRYRRRKHHHHHHHHSHKSESRSSHGSSPAADPPPPPPDPAGDA